MSQRILAFERDANFLRELETGFARLGAEVVQTRDVEAAVEGAKRGEVDLLLVSADALSSPGEVFLICKRFKSEDDLAKVPVIVLGGALHAESFEQHKKLKKRRADEYIETPISFDALWTKVRPLVSWGRSSSVGGDANVGSRIDVDADIDAFAESAFGDLVKADSVRPPAALAAVPDAPSRPSAFPPERGTGSSSFEVKRLEALVEELTSRAESAEDRAGQAERKLKAAEANRPSVHPAPTAVSSRDYLELREQLNRKDKELLSLRDEITSRDRRLIEASDRALVLERTQAELHDNLTETTGRYEDALHKVGQHEADLETAKKRAEGLNTRLSRAEEHGRALERELEGAREEHAKEVAERKSAHEQHVRDMEEQTAADVARLRAEHANVLSEAQGRHEAALAQAKSAHDNEISSLRAAHDSALNAAEQDAQRRVADEVRTREEALAAAATAAAGVLEQTRSEHASELANTRAQLEQSAREQLAAREAELTTQHENTLRQRDDQHTRELGAMARKLSEAESNGASLAQKLAETEQAKQELETRLRNEVRNLEGHLAARTEERDLTQNELGSARAQLASLEQLASQRADRIAALEANLSAAEHRIGLQTAKISADNELLERVRRALGIGVGLLEQQKQNVVDGL